jgi:hypothetical protein
MEANARLKAERLKTQAIVATYERRIEAQKVIIDRLLTARTWSDNWAWDQLARQNTELMDDVLLHKATTQRIIDLLRAEEGALSINVELVQAILNDGAEQEKLRREAFHG